MSESKIIDDLLNQSTELMNMRTILDKVGAYIYSKDLDGKYTYANSSVVELFGMPASEIYGKDDSHFFDLELSNQLQLNDRKVMNESITIQQEEMNYIKATGETRVYWTIKAPIFDENKEIIGMCGISTDITKQKKLESTLERESGLLSAILDNVDAQVYLKDSERRYVYVNPKSAGLLQKTPEEIVGQADHELLTPENNESIATLDEQVLVAQCKVAAEEVYRDEKGNERYFWSTKVPFSLPGHDSMILGISSEITELHQLRDELEQQATIDPLTGIHNRRYFNQVAELEFIGSSRYKQSTSLLSLDIDHFKAINDSFGHQTGDRVIKAVARHCINTVRGCDLVARVGGEEFAILLPQTNIQAATILAERLRLSFEGKVLDDQVEPITVTVSIGIASRQEGDESIESLIARADKGIYTAKRSGRNRASQG